MLSSEEIVKTIRIWNNHAKQGLDPRWLGHGTPVHYAEENPQLILDLNDNIIVKAVYCGKVIYPYNYTGVSNAEKN